MKKEIKLKKFFEIRYADPITSLDLTDNYFCFGSMLGLCQYYIINSSTLIKLSEKQEEFISGIKISKENLYICIGDWKIKKYILNSEENINNNTSKEIAAEIDNYQNELIHQDNCENSLTFLSNNFLIRNIISFPKSPNDDVPFDFDGKNYIIIDFIEKGKRIFYVYDVVLKEMKQNIEIETIKENKLGHISHLKIIKNDMIFIVQNYSFCEIRKFDLTLAC